jgi:PAS domain S-box-containing protein
MTIDAELNTMSRQELAARLRKLLENERELQARSSENERLVHELHVHQIELEMQNRQLREAQVELEQSRARYADLYDFAPAAHFTFDADGVVKEVNLAGAALLGRERANIVGFPFLAFARMPPSGLGRHLRRCREEGCAVGDELTFSTKRGPVEAQAISAPVLDANGGVSAYRTVFIDVGPRNEALRERERALQAEQRLRRVLEDLDRAYVALGVALASSQSPTPAVLQVIVKEARDLVDAEYAALGVSQGPDKPFDPFVHAGMDERVRERIGQPPRPVGAFGGAAHERRAVRLKDVRKSPAFRGFPPGHPVMTSFLGLPVVLGDHVLGSLYVANKRGGAEFTDDDQRALERFALGAGVACEIARLQGVTQEAVRSRDLALAIVSHDLRNPLACIALACTAILSNAPPTERRRDRRRVEQIQRATERMRRLIEDLFTATMIESGMLPVQAEPSAVGQLLEEAQQVFGPLTEAKSVRLDLHVDPGLPLVRCAPDRVLQAVSNLLGNAVKFSRAGQAIRIDARQENGKVVIAVSDEGPGIAPEMLPHVFDRYFKGDDGKGGAGLGLYITRGIIEAHGGRIWVKSRLGAGSTFSFTLPTTGPG